VAIVTYHVHHRCQQCKDLHTVALAKPRPGKKAKARAVQLQFPGMPPPLPPGITRILPLQLQIGDRMTDSTANGKSSADPT